MTVFRKTYMPAGGEPVLGLGPFTIHVMDAAFATLLPRAALDPVIGKRRFRWLQLQVDYRDGLLESLCRRCEEMKS